MLFDDLLAYIENLEVSEEQLSAEEKTLLENLQLLKEEAQVSSQVALLDSLDFQHIYKLLSELFLPKAETSLPTFLNGLQNVAAIPSQEFIF